MLGHRYLILEPGRAVIGEKLVTADKVPFDSLPAAPTTSMWTRKLQSPDFGNCGALQSIFRPWQRRRGSRSREMEARLVKARSIWVTVTVSLLAGTAGVRVP